MEVEGLWRQIDGLRIANRVHPAISLQNEQPDVCDFAYLLRKKIVDDTGRLTTDHQNQFEKTCTAKELTYLKNFLGQNRLLAGREVTLEQLLQKYLPEGFRPRFVGEEIYLLLGANRLLHGLEAIGGANGSTSWISQNLQKSIAERFTKNIEAITIRYPISAARFGKSCQQIAEDAHDGLIATFGSQSVSRCYHIEDASKYSFFYFDLWTEGKKIRITVVVATELAYDYIATADAVQILLPSKGEGFSLIDNGCGDQWVIDTVFKLLSIKVAASHLSKVVFRYIKEGYACVGNELEFFKTDCLADSSSYQLIRFLNQHITEKTVNQGLDYVLLMALMARPFLSQDKTCGFVKEALQVVKARFSEVLPVDDYVQEGLELVAQKKLDIQELALLTQFFSYLFPHVKFYSIDLKNNLQTAVDCFVSKFSLVEQSRYLRCFVTHPLADGTIRLNLGTLKLPIPDTVEGFLAHLILLRQDDTRAGCEALTKNFYKLFSSADGLVQELLVAGIGRVFSRYNSTFTVPQSEIQWIESLLTTPQEPIRRIGYDLLYQLRGHEVQKKKWLLPLLSEPSGLALRFILQLQSVVSIDEMRLWMKSYTPRSCLFYELLSSDESKWLPLALQVDWDAVFSCHQAFESRDKPLAERILIALTNYIDKNQMPLRIVQVWSELLERGLVSVPYKKILSCLLVHVPLKAFDWPEAVRGVFSRVMMKLSEEESKSVALELFPLFIHPHAVKTSHFEAVLSQLLELKPQLVQGQKSHFRFVFKPLLDECIAENKIAGALQLVDLYKVCCEEVSDTQTKKMLLGELCKLQTIPACVGGWYLTHLNFFSAKILPLAQMQFLLQLCERIPADMSALVTDYISQLHMRLFQMAEYAALQVAVVQRRDQLSGNKDSFMALFQPFFKKEKPMTVVAPKKNGFAHTDLQKLIRQNQLPILHKKLLACDPSDVEAKKLVLQLVQYQIKQKVVDPERTLFLLLERFQIKDFELWKLLFIALMSTLETENLAIGIGCLYRMRTPTFSDVELALWLTIIRNPHWLCDNELQELLAKPQFFQDLLKVIIPGLWQKEYDNFAYLLVKALAGKLEKKLLPAPFVALGYLWFTEIDESYKEARYDAGVELLKVSNQVTSDEVQPARLISCLATLVSQLVIIDDGLTKTKQDREAIRDNAKLIDRFVAPVTMVLRALVAHSSDNAAVQHIQTVVASLLTTNSLAVYKMLVQELEACPLAIQEVLAGGFGRMVIGYRMQHSKAVSEKKYITCVLALMERIITHGSLEALCKIYANFINEVGVKPSSASIVALLQVLKSKSAFEFSLLDDFSKRLYTIFAAGYKRFLTNCLTSERPLDVREALDVDIALSAHMSASLQAHTRQFIPEYKELFLQLFVRHIEEFSWCDETIQLFTHILFLHSYPLRLTTSFNPQGLDLSKVTEEGNEIIYSLYKHRRYYFTAYHELIGSSLMSADNTNMVTFRPMILKQVEEVLPTETKYIELSHALIRVALKRLKTKELALQAKARLLDVIASGLRTQFEQYPSSALANELFEYSFALTPSDLLFEAHRKIAFTVMRMALQKKIVAPDAPELRKWLAYFDKKIDDLETTTNLPLLEIKARIQAMSQHKEQFTPGAVVACQNDILSWYEASSGADVSELGECVKSIFALWLQYPQVLQYPEVLKSIDALFVPNSIVVASDRGNAGKACAFELAITYLDTLYKLFQRSLAVYVPQNSRFVSSLLEGLNMPLVLPDTLSCKNALKAFVFTLKRFMRFGVFEGRYEVFSEQARRVMNLYFANSVIPVKVFEESIVSFVHTCSLQAQNPAVNRARVALVHDWMVLLFDVHNSQFDQKTLKRAYLEFVNSKIIEDVTCEDLDKLSIWLNWGTRFDPNEYPMVVLQIKEQLQMVKKRIHAPSEQKKFLTMLPRYVRVE